MAENGKKTRKRKSTKFDLPEMTDDDWKVKEFNGADAPKPVEVDCPHCGDRFEVYVQPSDDGMSQKKSCKVCTQPVLVSASLNGDDILVTADRL